MSLNSVRRSQLIAPFGVGALQVTRGGVSVICCGLDHWYKREYGTNTDIDVDEFKVEEWRLQRELGVQHFRLPPDFRSRRRGEYTPNTELTVPTQVSDISLLHIVGTLRRKHLVLLGTHFALSVRVRARSGKWFKFHLLHYAIMVTSRTSHSANGSMVISTHSALVSCG